ncbi:hypothetical protein [Flavobacterium caseinilyticum]|uniref:hypothetical protein n=1 Tax=Flavobacterium caseinilyticum TaxID=2541732 RepID=UPI003742274D
MSVATSKGFGDFIDVIDKNAWNYKFFYLIFPSILQGGKAVSGIIAQLERIRKVIHHFDSVAIIRGGGGDVAYPVTIITNWPKQLPYFLSM